MQGSSNKLWSSPNARLGPVAKVSLSDGKKIDMPNAGLTSIQGAQTVIDLIKERRALKKLLLGGNELGDDGCEELFRFLNSEEGRRYKLEEICLNSNGIGDAGLEAISDYLRDNQSLRELSLQNNVIQGHHDTVYNFATAINSSHLQVLSIMNQHLSDSFLSAFLSTLDSPYLHELQISSIGLTPDSTPVLVDFLTSRHCWGLQTLKCNANRLGPRSIRAILREIKKDNFTLTKIELRENKPARPNCFGTASFDTTTPSSETEGSSDEEDLDCREHFKAEIDKITIRSRLLKEKVATQAIALLPYARAICLRPTTRQQPAPVSKIANVEHIPHSPPIQADILNNLTPFLSLPGELQHHILHTLTPMLSSAQVHRIIEFASSTKTLPPILPKLNSQSKCIPDPTTLLSFGLPTPKSNFCPSGKCMGKGSSVFCHRHEERNQWLARVRCDRFESDGLTEDEVVKLLSN